MSELLHALVVAGDPTLPAIVLLHGRGSDERDLLPIGRMLHPSATIISVRAPFDAAPWGYGPGYAWYRFLGGTTPESASFLAGQEALAEFLSSLPTRFGVIQGFILGGFSQGGTSALAYGFMDPGVPRGILTFSGFLADHPEAAVSAETVGITPIFWGHGTADTVVPFEHAEAGWETLRAVGAKLTAHAYPQMGHSISAQEIADAKEWLGSEVGI
jgi:phospholipase/carboxylesterase